MLGRVGLSLAKLNVLSRLVEAGGPLALGSLAERCSCVRSNITQLVDRLEAERETLARLTEAERSELSRLVLRLGG